MTDLSTRLDVARAAVARRFPRPPEIGLVLGSGLSATQLPIEQMVALSAADIPGLPVPSVEGHSSEWFFGELEGRSVVVAGGRVHRYEGLPLRETAFGVRLMALLGCRGLVVTNAAGGIRDDLTPGTLMRIVDHINLLGDSPLVGEHDPKWGARFVDMTRVYSPRWGTSVEGAAAEFGLDFASGVYAACLGPQYETPAEVRYLRTIGADAVGMSTVPEAIVARQMGLEVFGLSLISNRAAGLGAGELNHEEVVEAGHQAAAALGQLIPRVVGAFPATE